MQKAQEMQVQSQLRSPGKGNGNVPVFFPGEFHGQRRLVGYSPCGRKESDMTKRLSTAQPTQGKYY